MSEKPKQYRKDGAPEIRVLLVEDDPELRWIVKHVLNSQNINVLVAADGESALAAYREYKEKICLVLLDIKLPDYDGLTVLGEMQVMNPNVKCCLLTGGEIRYTLEELVILGALRVFEKPYANFSQIVETVMDVYESDKRSHLSFQPELNRRRAEWEEAAAQQPERRGYSNDIGNRDDCDDERTRAD